MKIIQNSKFDFGTEIKSTYGMQPRFFNLYFGNLFAIFTLFRLSVILFNSISFTTLFYLTLFYVRPFWRFVQIVYSCVLNFFFEII